MVCVFLVMAAEEKEGNTCCVLASSRVHVAEVTFTVQHLGARPMKPTRQLAPVMCGKIPHIRGLVPSRCPRRSRAQVG